MKLKDGKGTTLDLSIGGYQFPESDEYWDANWLVVRGHVEHSVGSWTFRDPCLTTFELDSSPSGLRESPMAVSIRAADTSPNRIFSSNMRLQSRPWIQLKLAHESAPPWLTEHEERLDGAIITFPVILNDPAEVSRSLRALLLKYPVRRLPVTPA